MVRFDLTRVFSQQPAIQRLKIRDFHICARRVRLIAEETRTKSSPLPREDVQIAVADGEALVAVEIVACRSAPRIEAGSGLRGYGSSFVTSIR